jgi:ribosomal-protein-alanine N-acetyltransferase
MSARQTPEELLPANPAAAELSGIRPASTADIYAIYKLNCESFIESWSVMALGLWQERGDDLDVWYDKDGTLAAYYLGQDVLDEVHIMQLAVAPQFQRQGLGSGMMRYEIERKRACGMKKMLLEVRASNRAAQQLYIALGFKVVGRRNDYYAPLENHPPEDALLMSFTL